MQDIRVALRHFRKSPGFAITVVLTIALGIGANTAIFTLVHAILMKSLPVGDPKTLYRVGDLDDCCIDGGFLNDKGDFDLFSYDLYKHFIATTPEFERLAAMQAGQDLMSLRHGAEQAKPERSEYVSGNYFTTFGITAFAGRMLTDADDTAGATPVAVLSYQTWQSDFGADSSMVGATIYLQSKPVTVVGIAPPGFYGDRVTSDPAAIWIPLALEPVIDGANANLHVPDSNWLYVIGRIKPGVSPQALQAKMSTSLRQWLSTQPRYTENGGSTIIPKQHVVITPRGRHSEPANRNRQGALSAHGHLRAGAAGGLRQRGQLVARAGRNPQSGDIHPDGARGGAQASGAPDAHRKRSAGVHGRPGWLGDSLCGNADDPRPGIPRISKPSHPCQPVAARPRLCLSPVAGYRHRLRHRPGLDHLPLRPG
jgi:hypothetical protein